MVEGDAGGGESLLDGGVDAVGVAVSGDRDKDKEIRSFLRLKIYGL